MKIDRRVFAMKMCWIALAILAIALSLWGAARPAAGGEEFSVWWSPKLEVESFDKASSEMGEVRTPPWAGPKR